MLSSQLSEIRKFEAVQAYESALHEMGLAE